MEKGFGLIAGRSRATAVAALAAAKTAGFEPRDVLTTDDGYIVPNAVLDAYEADLKAAHSAKAGEDAPVGDKPLTAAQKKAATKAAATESTDAPAAD